MKYVIIGLVVVTLIGGGVATTVFLRDEGTAEERFSSFGFKNDPTERPSVGGEEAGEYGASGDISEIEESEEGGWFTRWMSSRGDTTDEPEESGGGRSDASEGNTESGGILAQGGNTSSGPEAVRDVPGSGQTSSGSAEGLVSSPGTTDAPTGGTTGTTTLTVVSPTAGSVLGNRSGYPIATIFWTYANPTAKITIEVHNASLLVRTLTTKTANSGRYTWEYSPTLADGDYKVVVKAYTPTGTLLATGESGVFEVSKTRDPVIDVDDPDDPEPDPEPSVACPPVPSKVRTYTQADAGMAFYCRPENGGCINRVQLRHYRYPETLPVGKSISLIERCALTATPGSRTCPYTQGIYGSGEQVNTYSIMTKDPDSTNDPSEEGGRYFSAYLKPIIGISRANRAFDMSIPFTMSTAEVGKAYDLQWSAENQNLRFTGQYSISECEGDFSERAVWSSQVGDIWGIRAAVLSTNGLEGMVRRVNGSIGGTPILALKTGKTYYLNLRWLESEPTTRYSGINCFKDESGECLSPFVHTDDLPDSALHVHALWRQLAADPSANYLEFYRFYIFQYPFTNFPTVTQLEADPFFRKPGEPFIDFALYVPACGEVSAAVLNRSLITGVNDRLLNLDNTMMDSRCQPVCAAPGYVAQGNKCVKE